MRLLLRGKWRKVLGRSVNVGRIVGVE